MKRRWTIVVVLAAFLLLLLFTLTRREAESVASEGLPAGEAETTGEERLDSVVTLDSTALQRTSIELAVVGTAAESGLLANGTITYDANRVSVIAPRAEGRVVAVRADLGERVRAGSILVTLSSSEVGQMQGELERARVERDVARQNFAREKRLFEQSISSQKEMLEAEGAFKTAQASFASAEAQLRALGAAHSQGGTFGLVTPIAGTVVERNATPGQIAGPEASLFTVADLRRVWITVDVYESDFSRIRKGAGAFVLPRALPADSFPGRVTYAGGVVDTNSRTFKVRVEVENPTERLRPGMFAQVRLEAPPASAGTGTQAVPELAVQELEGRQVVFVPKGAPGRFVVREVTLGPRVGNGLVTVTGGVTDGERIVVNGSFQLKAELTKGSFGEEEE